MIAAHADRARMLQRSTWANGSVDPSGSASLLLARRSTHRQLNPTRMLSTCCDALRRMHSGASGGFELATKEHLRDKTRAKTRTACFLVLLLQRCLRLRRGAGCAISFPPLLCTVPAAFEQTRARCRVEHTSGALFRKADPTIHSYAAAPAAAAAQAAGISSHEMEKGEAEDQRMARLLAASNPTHARHVPAMRKYLAQLKAEANASSAAAKPNEEQKELMVKQQNDAVRSLLTRSLLRIHPLRNGDELTGAVAFHSIYYLATLSATESGAFLRITQHPLDSYSAAEADQSMRSPFESDGPASSSRKVLMLPSAQSDALAVASSPSPSAPLQSPSGPRDSTL